MGIFDKAKDAVSEHSEQIDTGIDKAGDLVDEKTEGKYVEQVDQGQEMAKDKLRDFAADEPDQPA
jgi:MT0933-like antitoxin protein